MPKKKNLGWLQLQAQPKTLTTASSETSTKAQKGSKETCSPARAEHILHAASSG